MKVEDIAPQVASALSTQYGAALPGAVERALGRPPAGVLDRGLMDTSIHLVEIAHFIIAVTPFAIEIWNKTRDRETTFAETAKTAETLPQGDNIGDEAKRAVIDATVAQLSRLP